jgi:4-hydroxy-tetrahydrodipicolinate synthase
MSTTGGVAFFPVTTFDEDGAIHEQRFREHVASTVRRAGFSHVIPLGSVGEFAYLSPEERKRVVELTIEAVPDGTPVVPGTSAMRTEDAVSVSRFAAQAGASGVLVTPHSYFPPAERTVRNYYRALNDALDVPIWVYDNPNTTQIEMGPEFLEELADLDGVDCVKSGTGDLRSFRRLLGRVEDLPVFAAPPNMFEKLLLGAQGWSGPVATIAPERSVDLFEAIRAGDVRTAREASRRWQPLLDHFSEYPYVATMKAALNLQGRDVGVPREPVQPLPAEGRESLRAELGALGLL